MAFNESCCLAGGLRECTSHQYPSDQPIYEVLIIGAGPCGLAIASRLCERCPSSLFTDDEHQRYYWIRRRAERMAIKNRKHGVTKNACRHGDAAYSTLVLDASGTEWLTKWNSLFRLFDISHLRSPMFFHLDPRDRDALLEFTYQNGRQNDCPEIGGCVGKERSKDHRKQERKSRREPSVDERDRKDYCTPSTKVFADQCQCLIDHHNLGHGLIKHEVVEDIDFDNCSSRESSSIFMVRTNKQCYRARVVVLAVGSGNQPSAPGVPPTREVDGMCHSMQIKEIPDPSVAEKMRLKQPTHIIVIGGGLTAAQLVDLAIRRDVTKVWHIMRSYLKVKPFDINLEWVGKFRNTEQAAFWTEDSDEERLRLILKARGGGSITSPFNKILESHISTGKLSILTNTIVESKHWDAKSKQWKVLTQPPVDLPPIDYIYYATGIQTNVNTLPYLQTMRKKFPIKTHNGLPSINGDLKWSDQVPLFVTGRLGALQLGPGAANLSGARSGAERIAWSISEYLDKDAAREDEPDLYYLGVGSRYASLEESSEIQEDNIQMN